MEPNLDSLLNFMANEPSSKLTGTKRKRDDEVTLLDYNTLSLDEKKEVIVAELNMIVLTEITNFINTLEKELGASAIRNYMPMQKGDVKMTLSDTTLLKKITGYNSKTNYKIGIKKFLKWYLKYYN